MGERFPWQALVSLFLAAVIIVLARVGADWLAILAFVVQLGVLGHQVWSMEWWRAGG